jgi:3(or 17)beta-hydroxysteroid dehydrogenase
MGRVSDKVAIVTGAASGMGKADAELLVREGAKVVLADMNDEDGQKIADALGDSAIYLHLNVSDEDNWVSVIAQTLETFGRLDILVNNAGIMLMGSNEGVFLGCKHAIPAMEATGGGSIVNMSSVASLSGVSFAAGYSASKGAVMALTKSIAMHCKSSGNNIRCNSIHPDGVKTPMVVKVATGRDHATQQEIDEIGKMGNMCDPEDIANMVLYLVSDESRFVNGAQMVIDNAATITPPLGV